MCCMFFLLFFFLLLYKTSFTSKSTNSFKIMIPVEVYRDFSFMNVSFMGQNVSKQFIEEIYHEYNSSNKNLIAVNCAYLILCM